MGKSSVMTLRVPEEVRQGLTRLAARFGHKPAQMAARLLEEGLRRRDFPLIDLRDTAGGRVAYLRGSRLTVCWVAQSIRDGLSAGQFAQDFDVSVAHVRAALAYAEAFPDEIAAEAEHAAANWRWIETQDRVARAGGLPAIPSRPAAKRKTRR
jgi:uncharacterized protein (DUF433 family)